MAKDPVKDLDSVEEPNQQSQYQFQTLSNTRLFEPDSASSHEEQDGRSQYQFHTLTDPVKLPLEEPVKKGLDISAFYEPVDTEKASSESKDPASVRNIVLISLLSGLVVVVLYLLFSRILVTQPNENLAVEKSRPETPDYTPTSVTGVLLSVDYEHEIVSLYSAQTGKEHTFSLAKAEIMTDERGETVKINAFYPGQLVDVTWRDTEDVLVERFRISASSREIRNTGSVQVDPHRTMLRCDGKDYRYDQHLICTYDGEAYPVEKITEQCVVNLAVTEDHVYTITVVQTVGKVKVDGFCDYEGLEIIFTPKVGPQVTYRSEEASSETMLLTEGFNTYEIRRAGEVVGGGTLFVSSGSVQKLSMPADLANAGMLDIAVIPSDVNAQVYVDGLLASPGGISLEYGRHDVLVNANGYDTYRETVVVDSPYQQMYVELKFSAVRVTVNTSQDNVDIYCAGQYIGRCGSKSTLEFMLNPGRYDLTLKCPGYYDIPYSLDLSSPSAPVIHLVFSQFVSTAPPAQESSSPGDSHQNVWWQWDTSADGESQTWWDWLMSELGWQ